MRNNNIVECKDIDHAAYNVMNKNIDSIYSGRNWSDVIVPGNTQGGTSVNDNRIYKEMQEVLNNHIEEKLI